VDLKPAGKLRDGLVSSESCHGYLGLERRTVLPTGLLHVLLLPPVSF
jgi:hypothetical protein